MRGTRDRTLALVFALACAGAPPCGAAAPPRLVLADAERHEVVFLAADGSIAGRAPTGPAPGALALDRGRLLVAAGGTERAPGSTVTLVDPATMTAQRTLFACEACAPRGLAVDPGGTLWLAAERPASLVAVRAPWSRPGHAFTVDGGVPSALAITPAGLIAATLAGGSDVVIFDPAARTARRVPVGPVPQGIAVRPGHDEVVTIVAPEGRIVTIDAATAGAGAGRPGPAYPAGFAFTPDGRRLLVLGGKDKILAVLDAESGRETSRVRFDESPVRLAVSPDGVTAAVGLASGTIELLKLTDDGRTARAGRVVHDADIAAMIFVP